MVASSLGLLCGAASAAAQAAGDRPGLRLGLTTLPLPVAFSARTLAPRLFEPLPFEAFVAEATAVRRRLAEREAVGLVGRWRAAVPAAGAAAAAAPAGPGEGRVLEELLPGVLGDVADLSVRVTGLGELGGSWTRYRPCDPSLFLNCNPSLFPTLRPDIEFGVQVAGTVSERIFVNVDYDQRREDFGTANRISVYYQGRPGELLQRAEVGDVALRLPASRWLTQGIPSGNFGFMAQAQLGPVDVQTVFAQQRGDVSTREFRLAGGGVDGLVQDEHLVLDDADYVKGQFFLLVDPAELAGSPHVDVQALRGTEAPASLRPAAGGTIQLYRDERLAASANQQAELGVFLADAASADGGQRHTGLFRRLVPGEDYHVHASGLWLMLRSPLRPDEALAVAFVTETGDTIGAPNAEQAPPGVTPRLRLLRSPAATHQPGAPTWDLELHNVYRVHASGGVEPATLRVQIALGDPAGGRTFREGPRGPLTHLRLFGLDDDAPADVIDRANVFQPARGELGTARIGGTFIIFPTLRPFAQPPPVPSEGLSADAARALLGGDANTAIYEAPDPVARDGAGRFRIDLRYRVQVDGLVSTFSLGQFGIRENTERLTVGGRPLVRGVDYAIDYELGIVTLTDPQSIFGLDPMAELRATFEQRTLFQVAPTAVLGTNATWRLGERGQVHATGIYQAERTLYTRPQLGVEPGAILLGGAGASLRLGGGWIDGALGRVPGLRTAGGAAVTLEAEVAMSAPNPNRRREAYLDDFEGADELALDLRRQQWRLGSRPGTTQADEGVLPAVLDVPTATRLVWQHDIAEAGAVRGNLIPQRDIDRQINVAGNPVPEPVKYITFGETGLSEGDRRWRSITTVLSTTGRDMTRSEFLEFYVRAADADRLALVIDIGTIGEDAFWFDAEGRTSGVDAEGRRWGLGVLDEEASVVNREVWGPAADARGLWDQDCLAEPLTAYPVGDPRANCTRGNGVPDTEDLDGNGVLDADDGPLFRWVVRLDAASPWLVRDRQETGTDFRLYRIPLRSGASLNGATDATWRFIRHLRLTVAGEPAGARTLTLARMRIIGSRWTKRDVTGVVRGLTGDAPGTGAATVVRVGPVSRLTDGAAYASPPGVRDQLQDPSVQFGAAGVEFNEKALRIAYDGLLPDERAEVYLRYPQQPRDFMAYRELRLWAMARRGQWGPGGTERLLVRVGSDPRNAYVYQSRLRPATGDRAAVEADWTPELVIDFEQWFALKVEAEERLSREGAAGGPLVLWSADSTYAVVLEDRARAPNLAAVRELVFAVYNDAGGPAAGEVWLNELRLGAPVRDAGFAGNVALSLVGDVVNASIAYSSRGALFRQLREGPTYRDAGDLSLSTRVQLDRLLPETFGLDVPLSVTHTRSAQAPTFLERTDVRADRLDGLRPTDADFTRVGMRIARRTTSGSPVGRMLLDGASLRVGWSSARTSTITTRDEASGLDAALDYRWLVDAQTVGLFPGFVQGLLRALAPAPLEESDAFRRLLGTRLRWTPERLAFGTAWARQENRAYRFDRILALPGEPAVAPIESPRRGLENSAEIGLLPFRTLTASLGVRTSRDLLDPDRATRWDVERGALAGARSRFAGLDVGWETNRAMTTAVAFRPDIAGWIRPSWTWANRYGTERNPAYLELLVEGEDTAAVLQRRFGSDRQIGRRLDLFPAQALRDAVREGDGGPGPVRRLGMAVQSVAIAWNSGLGSQFERETFEPGLGYRFGLGDLGSFRAIGGDTAAQAIGRHDLRLAGSFALPLDGTLSVNYLETSSEGFDLRGGRRLAEQRGWPQLRVAVRRLPLPPGLSRGLTSLSVGAGYERLERRSVFGGVDAQERTGVEDRFPLELAFTVRPGVTFSYAGAFASGESVDPTGRAEQTRHNHAVRVSARFAAPAFMQSRLPQPVQASLILSDDLQQQCRVRPAAAGPGPACVPYVDARTRTANLTIDTSLQDLQFGLRATYTDRRSAVGTRLGSGQFLLALFGQFNVTAGTFQPGFPR